MSKKPPDKEDRLEQHCRRLDTHDPRCLFCDEADPRCLEEHHIAGREYHPRTEIVCRNCHRKRSDEQLDHPPHDKATPLDQRTVIGRFLLGLCDFLIAIAERLREFGHWLIEEARRAKGVS